MDNVQTLLVAIGAFVTAATPIILGIKNGNTTQAKDVRDSQLKLDELRDKREQIEEVAAAGRIEAIVQDLKTAQARLREQDSQYFEEIRKVRQEAQRNWDLAVHYYGLLTVVTHLMNNIFQVIQDIEEPTARLLSVCKNAMLRFNGLHIPQSMEERKQK